MLGHLVLVLADGHHAEGAKAGGQGVGLAVVGQAQGALEVERKDYVVSYIVWCVGVSG